MPSAHPKTATLTPPFVAHCLELLAVLGPVRVRRMFGGWGFYAQDVFVALMAGEQLFLKTDESSRARFEAAGSKPFVFDKQGQAMTTSYWTVPDDALDAPPLFEPWARLALHAAMTARALRPVTKKKTPAAKSSRASTRREPRAKAR